MMRRRFIDVRYRAPRGWYTRVVGAQVAAPCPGHPTRVEAVNCAREHAAIVAAASRCSVLVRVFPRVHP